MQEIPKCKNTKNIKMQKCTNTKFTKMKKIKNGKNTSTFCRLLILNVRATV